MKQNNDRVANFCLELLSSFCWRNLIKTAGVLTDGKIVKNSVISGIKLNEAINKLEPAVLSLNAVLNEILDMKYNTNLAGALVDKSMKDMKEKANWNIDPFAKRKF